VIGLAMGWMRTEAVMRKSGQIWRTRDLAREYGFTDVTVSHSSLF
jgi:hypothetical protein